VRKGKTHHVGLGEGLKGFGDSCGIAYGAVFAESAAFAVNSFASGSDKVGAELAECIEHEVIVGQGLLGGGGRGVELPGKAEAAFREIGQFGYVDMFQQKPDIVIVLIKVAHLSILNTGLSYRVYTFSRMALIIMGTTWFRSPMIL